MEFCYKLTIGECVAGGAKRAYDYLMCKSGFFRTAILILGGAAILGSVLVAVRDGGVQFMPVILTIGGLLFLSVFTWLALIPVEAWRLYRQCGKRERTVRIEDGSIFVQDGGTVREYLCRDIQEFKKQGLLYRIAMNWRKAMFVELYLPVRLVGDKEEQAAFRSYVNDQRKISGDKLTRQADEQAEECEGDEECVRQNWNLYRVTEAMAENYWIQTHCMKIAGRRMRKSQNIRLGRAGKPGPVSQQSICEGLKQKGLDPYEESWKLYFTPVGIRMIAPQLESTWAWSEVGYLFETDDYFYFYSREEVILLYMEKGLIGDWMAQKLFVQGCQAKGIAYQIVQPEFIRDMKLEADAKPEPEGHKESDKNNFYVLDGGKADQKQKPDKKGRKGKKKSDRDTPDTQEGWRRFWAEKDKNERHPETVRVTMTLVIVLGIFLLAFLLPDFRGSQSIGGMPVMMDMPQNGEEYIFHPEAYKDYKPLADQVEVLQSLGFTIPEAVMEEMNRGMEEMPMARAWIEGYPYASLLSAIGMPERDYEAWDITGYSEQAYWFDWEGFDLDMEYVYILNGVNAMAGGEFTVTDAVQDMSDVDWEKGSGKVHLRFRINGEPYEYQLKMMNDWLDTDIIKDLNDALEKAGVEKRVYAMDDDGQGCILFCRDKEWAKRFEKATGIRLQTR